MAAALDITDASCFTDTSLCEEGITIAFWYKVDPLVSFYSMFDQACFINIIQNFPNHKSKYRALLSAIAHFIW